jgi:exonuclease SbcC
MEIINLQLKNFRTHRNLELAFNSGITGIIGNNGAGKSSVVEAISFLLTGEGYGAKADMLTVGEASGYVLGHLKIDGKEAVLERHLDSTKVVFKYDGITYKKAGEVAEIWEKLFQIDKNIFKNIVIARQGETALLFSGDNATKEKIFQKIFLVPNTTKIREALWNKYIKTAPPEYPLLDEEEQLKELVGLESRVDDKTIKLAAIPKFQTLDSTHVTLATRLQYLKNCKDGSSAREEMLSKVGELNRLQAADRAEVESIKAKLNGIDYHQINAALQQLVLDKPRYTQKQELEKAMAPLREALEKFEPAKFAELDNLNNAKAEAKAGWSVTNAEFTKINSRIQDFKTKGLVDSENCPHCGSELKDVVSHIAHLELKLPELRERAQTEKAVWAAAEKAYEELSLERDAYETQIKHFAKLQNNLEGLSDVRFDEAEYGLYQSVIAQYDALMVKKDVLMTNIQNISSKLINHNVELLTIPSYDNKTKSMDEEFKQVQLEIEEVRQNIEYKRDLELQLAKDKQLLELAQNTYNENKTLREKNEKRNRYLYILNELYELLHTSQFPRKLIQTYAGTVSEYLNEHLQLFNFPYGAKVNDNFGIDVFDTAGLKLPAVSGGQEVMLGVALRLSLHNMFGSAFPMMILDEGSVHLSNESKKSYFEIIKNLKKISNFKQIIIVDHDEDLSSVVDNTITL